MRGAGTPVGRTLPAVSYRDRRRELVTAMPLVRRGQKTIAVLYPQPGRPEFDSRVRAYDIRTRWNGPRNRGRNLAVEYGDAPQSQTDRIEVVTAPATDGPPTRHEGESTTETFDIDDALSDL